MSRTLLAPLILLLLAAGTRAQEIDDREIALHAAFLGAPELGPVRAGASGLDVSARYISSRLRGMGWSPGAPEGGYFRMRRLRFGRAAGSSVLSWERDGESGELRPGPDFVPVPGSGGGTAGGDLWLGADPGGDAAGRILLRITASHDDPVDDWVSEAAAAGAVALLVAPDPRALTFDEVLYEDGTSASGKIRKAGRGYWLRTGEGGPERPLDLREVREIRFEVPPGPRAPLAWTPVREPGRAVPTAHLSAAAADRLLGQSLAEVLEERDAGKRPATFRVEGVRVRIRAAFLYRLREIPGLVATFGSGPTDVLVRALYARDDGAGLSAAAALGLARALTGEREGSGRVELEILPGGRLPPGPPEGAVDIPYVPGLEAACAAVREALGGVRERRSSAPPPKPTLAAAREARYRGRLEVAARLVKRLLEESPGEESLYLERGRIRIASGDTEGAFADAENLDRLSATSPRGWLLRAEAGYGAGREAAGDAALAQAAATGLPEALLLRVRRRSGDRTAAAQRGADLRSVVGSEGESALGAYARALLHLGVGNGESCEEWLSRAIRRDPLLREAIAQRARVRAALETNFEGSVRDCDRARELGITEPDLLFTRGICFLKLRRYTLSIRDFLAYAKQRPEDASAVYNVACAHALMGNREDALTWLGRAVESGFSEIGHARLDPDLESIREDPRFERILTSTEAD